MKSTETRLASPESTRVFAEKIAKDLAHTPALILLSGDLGAGKTSFAQAFIKTFLPELILSSPTYSYLNIYDALTPIYHFDLYRISSADELSDLGLWEHLLDEQALRLVEWPENAPALESYADLHVNLTIAGPGRQATLRYLKSF